MKHLPFAEKLWIQTAFFLIALIPMTIALIYFDPTQINDISIWKKPLKFHVSLSLHVVTLAILASRFSETRRHSLGVRLLAISSCIFIILETGVLNLQAARGVASHFNQVAVIDQILYAFMGVGALILTWPAMALGVRFLLTKPTEKLTPGLKLGAGLGLTLGFILTVALAGYMSMRSGGHWVEAPTTDANGLPIMGWSRQGGDLRVTHFFATHLMQALPLAGFLADKYLSKSRLSPKAWVWIAAILGVSITLLTFWQAMSGKAFI